MPNLQAQHPFDFSPRLPSAEYLQGTRDATAMLQAWGADMVAAAAPNTTEDQYRMRDQIVLFLSEFWGDLAPAMSRGDMPAIASALERMSWVVAELTRVAGYGVTTIGMANKAPYAANLAHLQGAVRQEQEQNFRRLQQQGPPA